MRRVRLLLGSLASDWNISSSIRGLCLGYFENIFLASFRADSWRVELFSTKKGLRASEESCSTRVSVRTQLLASTDIDSNSSASLKYRRVRSHLLNENPFLALAVF